MCIYVYECLYPAVKRNNNLNRQSVIQWFCKKSENIFFNNRFYATKPENHFLRNLLITQTEKWGLKNRFFWKILNRSQSLNDFAKKWKQFFFKNQFYPTKPENRFLKNLVIKQTANWVLKKRLVKNLRTGFIFGRTGFFEKNWFYFVHKIFFLKTGFS